LVLDSLSSISHAFEEFGLLGVFLASFVGNLIPYSAVPYLAFIAAYAASFETQSRIIVTIIGGTGAAFGKYALYAISRYAGKLLSKEKREELSYFEKILSRKGFGVLAIFIFAALPLPDDILYVPLGIAKYNFTFFALSVLFGKIFLAGIAVFLGSQARWLISTSIEGGHLILGIIILLIAMIIFIMIVIFTDWKKVFITLTEKGGYRAFIVFLKEIKQIMCLQHPSIRKRFERKK